MINDNLQKKNCSMIDEIPLERRDFLFLFFIQWNYLTIDNVEVLS